MKLKFELTNCYGIGSLNEELDNERRGNTAILYASNGTMKTSLDSSGLNVPPVSLSNVQGTAESIVHIIAETNVPGVSL